MDSGKYGKLLPLNTDADQLAAAIVSEVDRQHDESAQLQYLKKFSVERNLQQHIERYQRLSING